MVSTSCIESLDFLTAKIESGYMVPGRGKTVWKQLLGSSAAAKKKPDSRLQFSWTESSKPKTNLALSTSLCSPGMRPVISSLSPDGSPTSASRATTPIGPVARGDYKLLISGEQSTRTLESDSRPKSPLHTRTKRSGSIGIILGGR